MTATIVDLAAFRAAKCPTCHLDYLNREIGRLTAMIEAREAEAAKLRSAGHGVLAKECEGGLHGLRFRLGLRRLEAGVQGGRA